MAHKTPSPSRRSFERLPLAADSAGSRQNYRSIDSENPRRTRHFGPDYQIGFTDGMEMGKEEARIKSKSRSLPVCCRNNCFTGMWTTLALLTLATALLYLYRHAIANHFGYDGDPLICFSSLHTNSTDNSPFCFGNLD